MSLGGAQRVMIEIIRQLESSQIETTIAVLGDESTAVKWPDLPVQPVFLGFDGSLRNFSGRKQAVSDLERLIKDRQIDVVHSHLWGASLVSNVAARQKDIPHLIHVHDTRPWVRSTHPRDMLRRWWAKSNLRGNKTKFVAVSQEAWRYNSTPLGISSRDSQVIVNGVNTDEFFPAEQRQADSGKTLRVGVVARFNPEKGHAVLIRASAELLKSGTAISLHLAGHGSLVEDCKALARDLGVSDSVEFVGMTTDVPGFLRGLDLFVLPSLACEGLPLSILEAMAVGVPVIATDVGGTSEVLVDKKNGLLIPPGDVSALATAIRSLAEDPDYRQKLSTAALDLIHRSHTWQIIAQEFATIYQKMAARAN